MEAIYAAKLNIISQPGGKQEHITPRRSYRVSDAHDVEKDIEKLEQTCFIEVRPAVQVPMSLRRVAPDPDWDKNFSE